MGLSTVPISGDRFTMDSSVQSTTDTAKNTLRTVDSSSNVSESFSCNQTSSVPHTPDTHFYNKDWNDSKSSNNQDSPPLSFSDDSDTEFNNPFNANKTDHNNNLTAKDLKTNTNNWYSFTSAGLPCTEKHSNIVLTDRWHNHDQEEQQPVCISTQSSQPEIKQEHLEKKNKMENSKLSRDMREIASICTKAVITNRPMNTCYSSFTRTSQNVYGSDSTKEHSLPVTKYSRDMRNTMNKKQKESNCKRRFQTPVKRPCTQDRQLKINQVFSQKPTTSRSKELINVARINEKERQIVLGSITTADVVALTLVYADSSTQLSGGEIHTKKSKLAKMQSDDQPIGITLVAMKKEEKIFVHIPLAINDMDKYTRVMFQNLMSNVSITKVCFGAKELFCALIEHYSFNLRVVSSDWRVDDPKIAAWLLDADHCPNTFTELTDMVDKQTPRHSQGRYMVCDDLLYMIKTMSSLKKKLDDAKLLQLYELLEVKICPILAVIETLGILVDAKVLLQYGPILQKRIHAVEKEALDLVGYSFNINSNPQLRQVLFDELKLDEKYRQDNSKGLAKTTVLQSKSTSESVLLKLKPYHKLPGLILEHRQLVKVKSTYIDGILEKVDDGKLHTSWDQIAASSGRLTSTNPNIQNIPKQVIMNAIKQNTETDSQVIIIKPRDAFKASEGKTLIAADFQSIELRLLAHLSQDAALCAVFNNPGVDDIFVELTKHWLGVQKKVVSATDRDRTKRIVYSLIYGAGTERLSETLSVSTKKAKELRSSFLAKFCLVKQFTSDCIERCRKQGFVETIFHRRRLLPNIKSSNFQERSFAERQAVNFVIQGSAADLCKSAMIQVVNKLNSRADLDAHLLLQIHDELLLESSDKDVSSVTEMLKSVMESTPSLCGSFTHLTVPIPVSINVGKTWGGMIPYTTKKSC
ncbi:DNA polymerase nu-like [Antedon mediterranea]|uniref:DNA polymerase nu-like n=1 Tax=Antedon mediterranea TaxID=105859 RepID=UPI003AF8B756